MKRNIILSFIFLCIFSIILIGCGKKGYRSIKVFKTEGTVNVIRGKSTTEASSEMKLKSNDVVEVASSSTAVLKLDNDKFVMAKENTTLRLVASGKANKTKTRILVDKGGVIVEVKEKLKEKESFEIASSNSVMAIRGTQISFDVEVKDNKITTSFAILDGNTEILLLKDNKLSSTTLSKDFRMSYTTDLSEVKTVKDISKLVDKTKPSKIEEVSDSDLNTIFNAVKEELTTEEIDSIVDTINEFERKDDDKINGTIKFKFNTAPEYTMDPKDYITIEEDWKDLVGLQYLYSKNIDGEYSEFNSSNPLEIGDWYCKIKAGNAYRSEPLKFSVSKIGLQINLSSVYYDDRAYLKAETTYEKLKEFFKSDLAQIPTEEEYPYSNYMYYIDVQYLDPDDTDGYPHHIVFDYDNFGGLGSDYQLDEILEIYIDYNLPNYYEIKGETDYLYHFEDYMDVKYAWLTTGNGTKLHALIDYFALTDDSQYPVELYVDDGNGEMNMEFAIADGKCEIPLENINSGTFYFKLKGTELKSKVYSFDDSNFGEPTGTNISAGRPDEAFVTYNEDGTINIYYDIDFNGNNTYNSLVMYRYTDPVTNANRTVKAIGDKKYSVLENAVDTSYYVDHCYLIKSVDGLDYVCNSPTTSDTQINVFHPYGFINAADDAYYAESYPFFIKGTEIKFYDENGNFVVQVEESDFYSSQNEFITSLLDYEEFMIYVSATVYGYFNPTINPDLTTEYGTFTDEAFAYVANLLKESGITIKGSNTHYVNKVQFPED